MTIGTIDTTADVCPQETVINKMMVLETITAARLGKNGNSVYGRLLPSGFVIATKARNQVRWSVRIGEKCVEGVEDFGA